MDNDGDHGGPGGGGDAVCDGNGNVVVLAGQLAMVMGNGKDSFWWGANTSTARRLLLSKTGRQENAAPPKAEIKRPIVSMASLLFSPTWARDQ